MQARLWPGAGRRLLRDILVVLGVIQATFAIVPVLPEISFLLSEHVLRVLNMAK